MPSGGDATPDPPREVNYGGKHPSNVSNGRCYTGAPECNSLVAGVPRTCDPKGALLVAFAIRGLRYIFPS